MNAVGYLGYAVLVQQDIDAGRRNAFSSPCKWSSSIALVPKFFEICSIKPGSGRVSLEGIQTGRSEADRREKSNDSESKLTTSSPFPK